MKRKIYLCMLLLIVTCIMPMYIHGKENNIVKVGYIDYAQFIEKGEKGEYSGYGVEYLEEIAKYTDWEYEYIYDTWENCLQKLEAGEIDLVCIAQYTKEREEIYDFPRYQSGVEYGVLYVNPDNKTFYYNDIETFNNRTIGFLKESFQQEAFENYAEKMGFTYKAKEYGTDREMQEALLSGEIDAMAAGSLSWNGTLRLVAKFSADPFYFMSGKGNSELLDALNDAMEQILCNNPYFEMQLYEKYYGTSVASTQPLFTRDEVSYINIVNDLKVAYLKDWYPYSYYNEYGEAAGALIQLCRRIENLSGLRFIYCPYNSISEIYQDLDSGKIDIIAVAPNAKHQLLDNSKLKISSPYLTSQVLLLSTKQYINETTGLNLVAVKSMKHLSNYFYEQFEVNHITWADKLEYCIGALEDNTADFAVVDYYSANKAMMIAGKEELLISQAINSKIEISLVISNDTDSRLMGILDNCIQYVSTMDAYEAVNMELSNQKSVFNLNAFLHEYSTVILLIALILTVAVTALIIILKSIFHRLSSIDKLTGCYNQTHFENIVPKILEEYTQRQYYIMIFDIYRFKYFIQYYGRKVGDDLLRSIASKVCNLLAGEEIMARTSENGFVVLVEEGNYLDLIQEFYFILDEVKSSFKLDISIKVNFGLYRIDDRNELVATMINKAILAQRMVRDNSDSMFAIYTDEMEKKLLTESRMEEEMKKALEEQEFKVFYQPKIDLKTKKIVGAEALIRWIKPDGTIVFPDQFIPVFERNGFIEQLDYYVLKEVSSYQMKRVKNNLSTFSISVNQSRYLLSNPQYVDNICKIMDEIGVPGQLIELEVTETLYIENHTLLVRVIKLLKERDIKFAIDDFGSGYSSLNLLTEMPADVLKIDREFLIDSDKSQQKKDVITKVVELAHMLNLDVVCEGVETKEQEEFLANISCDIAQGYYYSRPIPVDQFNLYVESNL